MLPVSLNSFEVILQEDFTDGNMPPVDPVLGPWVQDITANDSTWFIDNSDPYSDPYCATVHRGNYEDIQDERLITPSLNFSSYDKINLRFHWYTSQYTAVWEDVIDLIVGISLDDGWTWTDIWNEDKVTSPFVSWTWQDSGEIDLTKYAKEPNVKIRFRYYSNDTVTAYAQEFSIDDVYINGSSQQFSCNAGGPYEISWSWNLLNGVQFHGTVQGGQLPYLNWTWDFGDGNTSKVHFSPKWAYNDIGTYNLTLTVIDSATPHNIAVDHTTVKVVETAPVCVEITIKPSIGLIAEVKNTGTLNVSYLNWTMTIEWGPSYILHREVGNGVIAFIKAKSFTSIHSNYNIIWSGVIRVTIEIKPLNACRVELQQKVLIIGVFVYPLRSC
jgi:PKD repeat protein